MFFHTFKNTFKMLLRRRDLIFWSLIFPLILGVFFKLALGNVTESGKFVKSPVGVNEALMEDTAFKNFIEQMDEEGYFDVHLVKDETSLEGKEISCYIKSEDEIITKMSGVNQSIVESIMNAYLQNKEMVTRVMMKNPNVDLAKILKIEDHIKDVSRTKFDPINVYFYVLLGMQVLYGYSWGLYVIYQYEANLSTTAMRNSIAPVNKKVSLVSALLVARIINTAIVLISMLILNKVMKIDFGDYIPPLIGLTCLGSLTGVAFGSFIGASNKASVEVKGGLGIGITMLLSFLSGMMVGSMKLIIEENAPIINKINPVALFTDAIYSLYYYGNMDRYYVNIICLSLVTLVLILGTFFCIRGKQYDSL